VSESQYNQSVTLTEDAVLTVDVPLYYERIIVTNEGAAPLYVRCDGQAVTNATGGFAGLVMPGAWRMFGNDQPRQPLVSKTAQGSTVQNTGYQGATFPNLNPTEGGSNHTVVSLLCPTAAGSAVLEFV
jgi:hypothetical protein